MRADRLLAILLILQARGKMTTRDLARELGVCRRTILRDLDALSGAGVPVYTEGGPGGGVALDRDYRTNLTGLQNSEIQALFLSVANPLLDDIGLGEAGRSTLRKISAALPRPQRPLAEEMRQRMLVDPQWWWSTPGAVASWGELQHAVFESRHIAIVYERYDGQIGERELEPYALVSKSGEWYLVARREGVFRIYRADRIHALRMLGTTFERLDDFDLPSFWSAHVREFTQSLVEFRFRLALRTERLPFVAGLLPGRYRVEEGAVAEGWITLACEVEDAELARMLVFGLGDQCRVLAPPELQTSVLARARRLLSHQTKSAQADGVNPFDLTESDR